MASRYEVQVTIISAKDLKNINWKHGSLKPYAVLWIDSDSKCSTLVDQQGDTCPHWNQTLVIPCHSPIKDSILHVDIVHANAAEATKPLIGSAKLPIHELVDEFGFGAESTQKKLELKRPSGRPHGKLELTVLVRELRPQQAYGGPYVAAAPPQQAYGGPYVAAAPPQQAYGGPYGAAPPQQAYGGPYVAAAPPQQAYGGPYVASPPYNNNNNYGSYKGQAPNPYPYSGGAPSGYNNNNGGQQSESGMGMGTGLAVGAVAGVLGGLALAEGFDYVEDQIADDVADKVEDDLGYDDGGDY